MGLLRAAGLLLLLAIAALAQGGPRHRAITGTVSGRRTPWCRTQWWPPPILRSTRLKRMRAKTTRPVRKTRVFRTPPSTFFPVCKRDHGHDHNQQGRERQHGVERERGAEPLSVVPSPLAQGLMEKRSDLVGSPPATRPAAAGDILQSVRPCRMGSLRHTKTRWPQLCTSVTHRRREHSTQQEQGYDSFRTLHKMISVSCAATAINLLWMGPGG